MPFDGKPFDSINAHGIQDLYANQVQEGKTIDYKSSLPVGTDEDKREFLSDAASFASAGGYLVYGIEEFGGIPIAIPGLGNINSDDEKLRLENLLRHGVAPRIPGLAIQDIFLGLRPPEIVPENTFHPECFGSYLG